MVKTLAGVVWPNNTTKPSAGHSDKINETSQITSTKGDQTQNTTQQQLGLDSHIAGSKEMEKRDIGERTGKTAQRGTVLSEDGISAQPETKPAGKTYASTAATPASTNQGRGASVGVTSENINKRHHSQQGQLENNRWALPVGLQRQCEDIVGRERDIRLTMIEADRNLSSFGRSWCLLNRREIL